MGYESSGGLDGIEFSFEELERSASMLGAAGLELLEGAGNLARSPELPATLLVLGTASQRYRLLWVAGEILGLAAICSARAAEAGGLSLKVAASRRVYEQAESMAVQEINSVRGGLLPLLLLRDLVTNKARPRTDTMEDLINQLPEFLGTMLPGKLNPLGLLRDREHGGLFDTSVADRLYPGLGDGLDKLGLIDMGSVQLASFNGERTIKRQGSLETLVELQEIAELEPPGSILVSTVQGTGAPVHIVTIPGTQSAALRAEGRGMDIAGALPEGLNAVNPWDTAGIAEGMGFGSQQVSVAVSEALAQAGARPGDAVVFSGYSQGGIHAANLAGDTRLSDTYDVAYVLTLGSPVALAAVPRTAKALHLEDRQDMVPGTDGSKNPEGRNRVTVYFDGPDPSLKLSNDGFGQAHKLENYRDHVQELKGATSAGIVDSTGQLSALLAGSGSLHVRSYQLRRNVAAKPAPKPPAKWRPARKPGSRIPPVTSGWG